MRYVILLAAAFLLAAANGPRSAGATGFVVNSTGDGTDSNTADGVCNDGTGACTLRAAMIEANVTPGPHTIGFSIASGLQTIRPQSVLPVLTEPVTIDGTTQPGYAGKPIIEIDGTNAAANPDDYPAGFWIGGGSTTIRGLVINNFGGEAIVLFGGSGNVVEGNYIGTDPTGTQAEGNAYGIWVFGAADSLIGGTTPEARNIVSGNRASGIFLWTNSPAGGALVQGNYIGTDATGTVAVGNSIAGIELWNQGPGYLIGGEEAGAGNVISGNEQMGIYLRGAQDNVIWGNLIGTDRTGAVALGNGGNGIVMSEEASGNMIGGTPPGARNVISGNAENGILITNYPATGNLVIGNSIGSDFTGLLPVGNGQDGVHVGGPGVDGNNSIIGLDAASQGNIIAFNAANGVYIGVGYGATATAVRGNSIHSNGLMGIDNFDAIVVAPSPPTISSLDPLIGTSSPGCTIDIYSDSADEGRIYYGATTDGGSGNWLYLGAVGGPNLTATCTDAQGNTSEYSPPFANPCAPDDSDCDGLPNSSDNCPAMANPHQTDSDSDGFGDSCDSGPSGDVDCSGSVNSVDALKVLRDNAALSVQQSHPCVLIGNPRISGWQQGDVNCSGGVNSVDSLLILRVVAGLSVSSPGGCPPLQG